MFFCQHAGLQQARCADLPLSLPVITNGAPIVVEPNHSVGFRWNDADNFCPSVKAPSLLTSALTGCVNLFDAQVSPFTK